MQTLILLSASGVISNILIGLAMYRKLSIVVYQHKLLWADFADRKGLSKKANGASVGSE